MQRSKSHLSHDSFPFSIDDATHLPTYSRKTSILRSRFLPQTIRWLREVFSNVVVIMVVQLGRVASLAFYTALPKCAGVIV